MLVTLRDQRFKRGKSLIAMELSICRVLKYVVFFCCRKTIKLSTIYQNNKQIFFLGKL